MTLATAALFVDLPCALQSLVFLSNLSLGCIVLIVVYQLCLESIDQMADRKGKAKVVDTGTTDAILRVC